jgi:hypothetical protein
VSKPATHLQQQENDLNFFNNIHEMQITRNVRQPSIIDRTPLHRRLFATRQTPGDIARAAVREVMG